MKLILALFILFSSQSEILSYIDKNGKTIYVSSLDKVPDEYKNKTRENNSQISKVTGATYEPIEKKEISSSDKTILLVTQSCPYCSHAEDYLKSNRIKFKKLDIMESEEGGKLYTQLGGDGVPILKHGDNVVKGFDRAQYENIFNK